MPAYLMRFSYTPETWSRLIQNPEDRRDAARAYIEQVGGALHGFWYGFGEYDGYAIFEAPDNVSVAGAVAARAVLLGRARRGALRPLDQLLGADRGAVLVLLDQLQADPPAGLVDLLHEHVQDVAAVDHVLDVGDPARADVGDVQQAVG